MLEHDKPITSNGYPIIEMDKCFPYDTTDGLYRILVKRPPEMCPFPEAPYVVAVKDFNNTKYDGWLYALSYDLKLHHAVFLLYGDKEVRFFCENLIENP